jgi:putative SOS response-associated peptidase YedK
MCGRFAQRSPAKKVAKQFKVEEVPPLAERYNVAPAQMILGIREEGRAREATFFKWGLVPRWAKDPGIGNKLINARSETVEEKPSFRGAFRRRRCIIPADGFYEWKREAGRKHPFYFRMRDERPFGFAGLWERWEGEGGEAINSCTILTTEANKILSPVHDRMPIILDPENYSLWLEGDERDRELLRGLLRPYPATEMVGYPVSTLVNSPSNGGAELIEEARLNLA